MPRPLRASLSSATLALGIALGLAACSPGDPAAKPGGDGKPVPVVLATVTAQTWQPPVEGLATLRAQEAVVLTAPAAGRVRAVLFRDGQSVQARQALVQLEDDEERANFAAASVNADLQKTRYERAQSVASRGLLPQDELDAQAQALKDAEARRDLARVKLDQRTLYAPFAGVLGIRQVSPGAVVEPATPIVTLDAVDVLLAEFQLPEAMLGALAPGAKLDGKSPAWPARTFHGTVTLLGARVDPATRTVAVQARIDNRDHALRPGMLLNVHATGAARAALFVPESAVVPEGTRQYVWRAAGEPATAEQVDVVLGARRDGTVEILGGLAAGDRIVTEGQASLRPGRALAPVAAPGTAPAEPAPAGSAANANTKKKPGAR